MSHYHAVVWLDHTEAHVIHFSRDDVQTFTAHASDKHPHLHHKRGSVGSGHRAEDAQYFGEVPPGSQPNKRGKWHFCSSRG